MKLTPTTITPRNAVESLRGFHCPFDGRPKQVGNSLCGRCYHSLPEPDRKALYRRVGSGYKAALAHALTLLEQANQPAPSEGVST